MLLSPVLESISFVTCYCFTWYHFLFTAVSLQFITKCQIGNHSQQDYIKFLQIFNCKAKFKIIIFY